MNLEYEFDQQSYKLQSVSKEHTRMCESLKEQNDKLKSENALLNKKLKETVEDNLKKVDESHRAYLEQKSKLTISS